MSCFSDLADMSSCCMFSNFADMSSDACLTTAFAFMSFLKTDVNVFLARNLSNF